jgi:hypothetical protein
VKCVLAVMLVLVQLGTANAQVVRGTIIDTETSAPLRGVFVVLLDSAGHARGGVLTDEKGVYALPAQLTGTFTLRAERIGHKSSISSPFVLTAGQTATVDMRVAVAPIELAPLGVEATNRCIRRPRQGQRTAQLWEEVRKALSVARWAEQRRAVQFQTRSYVRELDATTLFVRRETQRHDITGRRPYAAADVDTLVRYGFVRNEGAGKVYYGPDAELLLSDVFLDHHCFHTIVGAKEQSGMIGLAFQPAMGSKLPDIAGALWLDARTLELNFIEFRYVNLEPEYRVRGTGGRTEFRRLNSGVWIVSGWYIRMPVVASSGHGGAPRVVGIEEEGGEVVSIHDLHATQRLSRDGAVIGVVFDSLGKHPLAQATVYLSGTAYRTVTDQAGRFTITNVPPGRYLAAFTHAALDSVPALPEARAVDVAALETARIDLGLPRESALLANACPDSSQLRSGRGLVFGYVRDARNNLVSDATISLLPANTQKPLTTDTDAGGYYILCGAPLQTKLQLRATRGDRASERLTATIDARRFRRIDLVLPD